MRISFVWAILNLLPILPLDGGRMLDAVLGPERIHVTLWITIIVAVLVALVACSTPPGSILLPLFPRHVRLAGLQALKENRWR